MIQNKTPKGEADNKIKLSVRDLRPGMYVCELDRPWLEMPFKLRGFMVKDFDDIDVVMKYCEYVYIDPMRTHATSAKSTSSQSVSVSFRNKKYCGLGKRDLEAAEETRQQTLDLIKTFATEIQSGKSIDLQLAKSAVTECLAGVLRNPESMMFITRFRDISQYNSQHAFNVCIYSLAIGRLLGLDSLQLETLGISALLHDMGKERIPEHILNKQGRLNEEETAIMQSHTTEGRDILMSGRNICSGVADVAYSHHENLDGTGYPRGLKGFQFNMNCKIVSVVDKYDAISSMRPYRRRAGDHMNVVSILNKLAKTNKIHSKLTSIFLSHLGFYPSGSIVELSSGEVGIVIDANPEHRLCPQILVVRNHNKEATQRWVDLAEKKFDDQGNPYKIVAVRRTGDFGIDLAQTYEQILRAFEPKLVV